jgi:hypothetical protein
MAEAERLLLPDGDDFSVLGFRRAERVEALALLAHGGLELERDIEIIDQARLAAAGDEDHLLDPGLAGLVDRILDQRPVDDRQHLLGDGLGRRKQARSEPGDGKDGLSDPVHSGVTGPTWSACSSAWT